jgi:hypothetical protein
VTRVRFWNEGRNLEAEYFDLKRRRPSRAKAIREAITLVCMDPDRAEHRYSIELDKVARYMAMPFLAPDGLTCLVWRQSPDGDDVVVIVDFDQPWDDDLDMPPIWPRPDR